MCRYSSQKWLWSLSSSINWHITLTSTSTNLQQRHYSQSVQLLAYLSQDINPLPCFLSFLNRTLCQNHPHDLSHILSKICYQLWPNLSPLLLSIIIYHSLFKFKVIISTQCYLFFQFWKLKIFRDQEAPTSYFKFCLYSSLDIASHTGGISTQRESSSLHLAGDFWAVKD